MTAISGNINIKECGEEQQQVEHSSVSASNSEANIAPVIHNADAADGDAGAAGVEAAVKTPNSYKYPLLKRYYEFGPWVGRNRKAICLGCHLQTSSSQPDRLLKHLNRCNALSDAEKVAVTDLMNERTANKRKKPMSLRLRRDGYSDYDDEAHTSLVDDPTLSSLNCQNSISIPPGGLKKHRGEHMDRNAQIDEALTRWIMMCRIPLKAIHSAEFVAFCRALDPNYHIPSKEQITNVLIPGLLNII